MKSNNIGVIGIGHLGLALTIGLHKAGYHVYVNNGSLQRTQEKVAHIKKENIKVSTLRDLTANCQLIVLCINHNQLTNLSSELSSLLHEHHILISALAQAPLSELITLFALSHPQVVKLMTTLSVSDTNGVTAYQLENNASFQLKTKVEKIISAITAKDCLLHLETESEMQVFTTLVGCFPGIEAYFLHQMELSGQKYGGKKFAAYSKMLSTLLRATADLLDAAGTTQQLKVKVATKGGVTEAILRTFDSEPKYIDDALVAGLMKMRSR